MSKVDDIWASSVSLPTADGSWMNTSGTWFDGFDERVDQHPEPGLVESLRALVPIWMATHRDICTFVAHRRARACARVVGEKGDILQFSESALRNGKVGEAFSRLAEGIALLAFEDGGIDVYGLHFDAGRPLREPVAGCTLHWCPANGCCPDAPFLGRLLAREVV